MTQSDECIIIEDPDDRLFKIPLPPKKRKALDLPLPQHEESSSSSDEEVWPIIQHHGKEEEVVIDGEESDTEDVKILREPCDIIEDYKNGNRKFPAPNILFRCKTLEECAQYDLICQNINLNPNCDITDIQMNGLRFMLEKEKNARGGIMGSDVGTGKTRMGTTSRSLHQIKRTRHYADIVSE
jgi:SNF2 family DNA or RNA helicase